MKVPPQNWRVDVVSCILQSQTRHSGSKCARLELANEGKIGANPAEPIVTENQSLAKPTQGMCNTEDIKYALEEFNVCAIIEGTGLTTIL